MICIVCGNLAGYQKNVCENCLLKTKKMKCKDCASEKLDIHFYVYKKTNKPYAVCKDCFNKKVMCENCHQMINKTYLKKHIEKCKLKFGSGTKNLENENDLIINKKDSDIKPCAKLDLNIINSKENNRTLIVGPSFCGKTHLLINLLKLKHLTDPDRKIKIITRSPEQYYDTNNIGDLDFEIEQNFDTKTINDFEDCIIVFDDMLDANQKLIDPFFTRGRHKNCDVYYLAQSYFDLPKRTIRNNSNIVILFKQTLKDVENLYRDIAGFDMSYEEFKQLCKESWTGEYNYLKINRQNNKNDRYTVCNESCDTFRIYIPETDPF